jgi:hypothetical protein
MPLDASVISINAGDVIIISTALKVSDNLQALMDVEARCKKAFPGHKCLVLPDGVKVAGILAYAEADLSGLDPDALELGRT